MNWIESYPNIAHRGLHGNGVVENTERAVELAIKNGYAIEVDVQFLLNGEPVIFHDDNLNRLFDDPTYVKSINPKFVTFLRYADGQQVLFLKELLELLDGRAPLLIEVKNDTFSNHALSALVKYLLSYRGKFSIQSFNPQIIKKIKAVAPSFSVGQLVTCWHETHLNFWQQWYLQFAEFYNDLDFISVDKCKIGPREIFISKLKNINLISWTIKSDKEKQSLSNHVSGVIFEGFLP